MKKILYAILAMMLMGSCSNYIELDVKMPDKRLNLNALLSTGDQTHEIFLYERTDSRERPAKKGMEPVKGAEVTCYVNGEVVAVAEEVYVENEYDDWGSLRDYKYVFNATFRPGDKIRIEARRGDDCAYAEVVAPDAVDIELLEVLDSEFDYNEHVTHNALIYSIGIDDIKGEDTWFRVGNAPRYMDMTYHFHYKDGTQIRPDGYDEHVDNAHIYIEKDPVLNDGYMPDDRELLSNLNPTNEYRIFSDSQFKDSKAEVKFYIDKYVYSYYFFQEEWEAATSVDATLQQEICIEAISFETYCYYRALNVAEVWGYEISFISEPVILPCNVTGGLGFVGIATANTLVHDLPPRHGELPDYMYDYFYGEGAINE